jgi:hypothetical protein
MMLPVHIPEVTPIAAFAILSRIPFAAVLFSAIALFVSHRQCRRAHELAEAARAARDAKWEQALADVSRRVESLGVEWRDILEQFSNVRLASSGTKIGLNLTKRAQALRMHRRGDPPEQIAALLEMPLQEVDLMLKVQGIALKNL